MTTHYALASNDLVRQLNREVGTWLETANIFSSNYSLTMCTIVEYELNKRGLTAYVSRSTYPKGVGRPI